MAGRRMTPEEIWILAWYRLVDSFIEIITFGYVSPNYSYNKYNEMFIRAFWKQR